MKTLIELTQSALAVLASLTPLAPWGLCGASAPVNALKPGDTTEAFFAKIAFVDPNSVAFQKLTRWF
jgi:hypothetical protein